MTADNNKGSDQNGRAIFLLNKGPSVTVTFNPEAFGNRPIFLETYGFRMPQVSTATGWQIPNRLPTEWEVYVSSKENPTDEDWVLVDSRSGIATSKYGPVNSCYTADFPVGVLVELRHVRFVFTKSVGNQYIQLGEICMSGLIAPDEPTRRDVCFYETKPVVANLDGSVEAKVSVFPVSSQVDPYDFFVTYRTGNYVVTNLLERATTFTGFYKMTIPGLRLGVDYSLQFGAIAVDGSVLMGDVMQFLSSHDVFTAGIIPAGYEKVEYIESTDAGRQYIDCGFAPDVEYSGSGDRLGFAIDFIGYNAFQLGANYDKDNRDDGYGTYLCSMVKGQGAKLLISSSTGGKGTYPNGLFWYNGIPYQAKLVRNERMQITLSMGGEGSNYNVVYGSTTSSQTIPASSIKGPNVFVFAAGNGAGNVPDQFGVMRLYSLKFYNDHASPRELIHDFVPARKISDGKYGLYDVVANRWCPNGSDTPFVAGAPILEGDTSRVNLSNVIFSGQTLTALLTRGGTEAVDVYVSYGSTYGGIDESNWQNTERCGAFAENEATAQISTSKLGREVIYARFHTADGKWSETLYLPDCEKTGGFVIIVR